MRAAVLHVNSSAADSTSPTMRIARYVAETLGLPLIHDRESAEKHAGVKFDALLVKHGMLKFSDHRDQALELYGNASLTVNLENDYTFVPDKRFRKPDFTWSTVEGRDAYVNWNVITRHGAAAWGGAKPPLPGASEQGLIYYGAHRPDRVSSFRKYFGNAPYQVTVSSYRGGKAFAAYGKNVRTIGAFRDPDAQARWPLTIYVEDDTSHDLYCSPATRFYECVMAGLAQVVDVAAVNTLRSAGIDVPDRWVVGSQREVAKALARASEIQREQRAAWWKPYHVPLGQQLRAAWKAVRP